ncbi:M1 family peptidase, partial [Xanthomonas citri pv. citri]|nr:M1 family peptidase [Xanthomonas citri pv. citri]
VLRVRLAKQSRRIELDLHRLRVSRVAAVVDGRAIASSFTQPGRAPSRLVVDLGESLPEGTLVELTVVYAGTPTLRRSPWGTIGWEELTDGVL